MNREWERFREEPGSIPAGDPNSTGRVAVSDGGTDSLSEGVHKETETCQKDTQHASGQASLYRGCDAQGCIGELPDTPAGLLFNRLQQ